MGKDYWKKTPAKPVVVVGVDAEGNVDPTRTMQVALSGSNTVLCTEKTVAAAATPEALGAGSFNGIVRALDTNTSTVYLGNSTRQTAPMLPGEERELLTADLSQWYLKVSVDGEGVDLIGGQ